MKRKTLILATGVLSLLAGWSWADEPSWQEVSRGLVDVKAVLICQDNPQIIYIGTERGIFKTKDSGNSWQNVFSLRGVNHAINYLALDTQDKKTIYAATADGLFFSLNAGQRWSRIFKGKNSLENDCITLAILPYGMYLGTKSGLFISKDKGRSWHKESGKLGESRIFNLAYLPQEPNTLYLTCVGGVFKSNDAGISWERVFISYPVENDDEHEEETEDRDEQERYSEIRYIAVNPHNPNNVYLATSRGVYQSKDKGASWQLLPGDGLLSRDTQILLFSAKDELYSITKPGVFVYKFDSWRELSFNLSAGKINSLALDQEANLYAGTDKGLYKMGLNYANTIRSEDAMAEYSKGEPKIDEVQRQAIKYAEVEPEKILRWRQQAAKKAVFPKVSANLGRNVTDLWHWETGSTTKNDDDSLRRGNDAIEWDLTLSWDLSELVWNSDQTSIDVRSRLMVELRDDILDEVNKLYFERIRLKMETDNLQIEDRKKRFEKELRIAELTASLDSLTGGYFSGRIKKGAGLS